MIVKLTLSAQKLNKLHELLEQTWNTFIPEDGGTAYFITLMSVKGEQDKPLLGSFAPNYQVTLLVHEGDWSSQKRPLNYKSRDRGKQLLERDVEPFVETMSPAQRLVDVFAIAGTFGNR